MVCWFNCIYISFSKVHKGQNSHLCFCYKINKKVKISLMPKSSMRLCFFVALLAFCLPVGGLAQNEDLTVRIIGDKACNDGVDNDGDDKIDFGSDPGCESGNDADEYNLSGGGGGYNPQTVTIVSDMSGLFGQKKDEEKEEGPLIITLLGIFSRTSFFSSSFFFLCFFSIQPIYVANDFSCLRIIPATSTA